MPNWTDRQKEAIGEKGKRNKSLLVSAAAGSGKTAVLVERIKRLILEDNISLENMLIVTFTNAAALEMRGRLRKELSLEEKLAEDKEIKNLIRNGMKAISKADIGTYDSFALKLVKKYYHVIGVDPGLRICDEHTSKLLEKEAIDEIFEEHYKKKDADFFSFLDAYTDARSDAKAKDLILSFSKYTDTLPDPDSFINSPEFDSEELLSCALKDAKEDLIRAGDYFVRSKERLELCGAPELAKKLAIDIEYVKTALSFAEKNDFDGLKRALCSEKYKFQVMRAKKAEEDAFSSAKPYLEGVRDKGKDIIKDLIHGLNNLSPENLEKEKEVTGPYIKEIATLTKDFKNSYTKKKRKKNYMDFSDVSHFAIEILKNSVVREECKNRYKAIFVDEYQDSNPIQDAIVDSISSGNNVFMVGDVKQSIYKFRHAEPALFIDKYDRYKKGSAENCSVVDLNSNFRSKSSIIDFVNTLFERIMTKESCSIVYDKDAMLYAGAEFENPVLYDPYFYAVNTKSGSEDLDDEIKKIQNAEFEALLAVNIIKEYLGKPITLKDKDGTEYTKPLEYRDMAVLFRNKTHSETFYEAFRKSGIPAYMERTDGYFDAPEITVFLNLLRIINNFSQDVPLISVLHFPSFGFSSEELAKIRIYAKNRLKKKIDFSDAFKLYISEKDDALSQKSAAFMEKIQDWKIKQKAMPLADFLWKLLFESDIFVYASALPSGEQRAANLRALVDKAASFEQENFGGLYAFVSYIENISDKNFNIKTGQSKTISEGENVVRMMTVHKSKGLEFPFVLFTGCSYEFEKKGRDKTFVFHKDMGCSIKSVNTKNNLSAYPSGHEIISRRLYKEALAEEIRVIYVGATRAKDILIFTGCINNSDSIGDRLEASSVIWQDVSNMENMIFPSFKPGHIKEYTKDSFDLSIFETAKRNDEAFKKSIENGFDVDENKLPISLDEISKRLSYQYEKEEELQKRKYSVSEISKEELLKNKGEFFRYKEGFDVPKFAKGKARLSSAGIGTAYHSVMENMPFTLGEYDEDAVLSVIGDLVSKNVLSEDEAAALDASKITDFFNSELGSLVKSADDVKKETPFVMKYNYDGREVLVQGVIDCFFKKDGRLYLVDYKSNYIDMSHLEEEKNRLYDEYKVQLSIYKEALEKLSGEKVYKSYLYLFSAGTYILMD